MLPRSHRNITLIFAARTRIDFQASLIGKFSSVLETLHLVIRTYKHYSHDSFSGVPFFK